MSEKPFDWHAHAESMRARGLWQDLTLDDLLTRAVSRSPDKTVLMAYRADTGSDRPVRTLTYRELEALVARAAGALRGLGIGKGDIVGLMLPNWWEFVVYAFAINRIGAVVNPLMYIFRERELRYMLGFAGTRAIVIPDAFRGFRFPPMLEGLRGDLPLLEQVIVVGGEEDSGILDLLRPAAHPPVGPNPPERLAPDALSCLMYTSGTTGEPKGVMHCYNSLIACCDALGERFRLGDDCVLHGCSPVGHMNGYASTMLLAIYYGGSFTFQDIWEPKAGVAIMAREGVNHISAATPFLADMCNAVEAGAPKPPLRTFHCGGAQIPPSVIERGFEVLDVPASSLWGMTEALGGSLTEPERAREKSSSTDGRVLKGMELLITDDDYKPLPVRKTGRLLVRGAAMFMGYYKRPDLPALRPGGWFDTGDMAYMDEEGYIRIDGRTKDIIIRGGENIPVMEIETLLYRMPAVADAALVAYPDERLGERACAFVVLKPDRDLALADIRTWMGRCDVAKQYWPERLEIIDAMPRTASGKIQKNVLREQAAATRTAFAL
ncbi:MAG: AMP-binding protein [Flavobacteriaceae bacterium]